jgi:hypothetical protein
LEVVNAYFSMFMKKEFFLVGLFLLISSIASAQWPAEGGLGGSSGNGGMIRQRMPDAQLVKSIPPFLKGNQTLAETWSSTIAAFGNNPDGMTVNCFAEDSDNLYVGGDFLKFDTVHTQFIAGYNRKTGLWYALDAGLDNDVLAMVMHNGKLYVGGSFNHAGSGDSVVNYIAMWDGTSWHSLAGGMNAQVNALAFIGDTLYAGGDFGNAGGIDAEHLAYWDGQNWYQADGGVSAPVECLFATHDSLFVGGGFHSVYLPSKTPIVANGTAMLQNGTWTTFGPGYNNSTLAFFNGKLWAGGQYFALADNSLTVNGIAYWDGSNWNAVSSDTMVGIGGGQVNQLTVLGDSLIALGEFSMMDGVPAMNAAVMHNGAWSELGGGIYGFCNAAISFNGSLYVGGEFTKAGTVSAMGIASYANGSWTASIPADLFYNEVGWQSAEVRAIATTARYVFIGGNFVSIAHQPCNHVAAYDKQLGQWIPLGAGVDGTVRSLAVSGNTLIVGGEFTQAGTIPARHIAECNITSKIWSAMGAGAYRSVNALTVDSKGMIYTPIFNPSVNNIYYDDIGVWDGTGWSQFGNGLNSGFIDAITWIQDTLYAVGSFSRTDDGTIVNGVAQLQNGIWGSLNGGLNAEAYTLTASDNNLYVGGEFTEADGQVDSALAMWNNQTQEWNPIGAAGFNGPVLAIASDGNGGVYAGGEFSEVAQVGRGNLVHWNGSAFGTVASGVNNTVASLAPDESALYAGGWFTEAGSTTNTSLHFGALDGAGASVSISPSTDVASFSIYPNPATGSSTISVDLVKAGNIHLEVFNELGDRVLLIANGDYQAGPQMFTLDASKLIPGIYFLRLTNDGSVTTQNFVVQ